MKNAADLIPAPTPEDTISFGDAFEVVYRALNPDWQTLEERLNPASQAFQERDAKDRAHLEACGNYDKAQRLANEWLRERITQGALIALVCDPDSGQVFQSNRHKWASMGDFETGIADDFVGPRDIFQSGPNTVVNGEKRPVFFDRKIFDSLLSEPNRSSTASKNKSNLRQFIRDVCSQLWPNGYKGRAKERDEAILREFKRLGRKPPSVKSIQRALIRVRLEIVCDSMRQVATVATCRFLLRIPPCTLRPRSLKHVRRSIK